MSEENRALHNEPGLGVSRTEINGEEVFWLLESHTTPGPTTRPPCNERCVS